MASEGVERVREVHGDRAARRHGALTDLRQCSLSDFQREGGAIPR